MRERASFPEVARPPCRSCGNGERPDTVCSYCGGYGMITNYGGDPDDCPACGCSGMQWPPVCPNCGKFRSMRGWETPDPLRAVAAGSGEE